METETGRQSTKPELKVRAYTYALNVIRCLESLDSKDLTVQILSRQLMRSGTSVGANIIEAQAGSTKKDFTNFFSYALKSANESKFWIGLLRDSGKLEREKADDLLQETSELAMILGASIITLKGKR